MSENAFKSAFSWVFVPSKGWPHFVCLRHKTVSFLKAPRGHKPHIKLSILWGHFTLDLPVGWSYTFKWVTISNKCCHLSAAVCLGFHLSVAWDAEGVVGASEKGERRRVCLAFGHCVVFAAQASSHTWHSSSSLHHWVALFDTESFNMNWIIKCWHEWIKHDP